MTEPYRGPATVPGRRERAPAALSPHLTHRVGTRQNAVVPPEYRASFDAAIRFSNGGDLTAHGFRVDIPSPDVDEAAIAALFVASLGLLMTHTVPLSNIEILPETHKG